MGPHFSMHEDLYCWRMVCELDRVKIEKVACEQPKAKFQHEFQILPMSTPVSLMLECCDVINNCLTLVS